MSLIKPGQYSVMTMKTDGPAHISWLNWRVLRRTGYRVCIRDSEDIISISGSLGTKDKAEKRLKGYNVVARRIPIKDDIFYAPFHNGPEMEPYAGVFRHCVAGYCKRKGAEVFRDLDGSLFVTNGNRVKTITSGEKIMDYISSDHIVQLCDFRRTMQKTGELTDYCIGIGQMNFQKRCSDENGYIKDFFVFQDSSKLTEAARFYEAIPESREAETEPVIGKALAQPYQLG